MKPKIPSLSLVLVVVVILLSFYPTQTALAVPPCYGSGCNGVDPAGTSCEGDKIIAARAYSGSLMNTNYYSPSCNANWSVIRYSSRSWLAAETVGVYIYHGVQLYSFVWNSMWDGSNVVCTRGHQGPAYMNYILHTPSACA